MRRLTTLGLALLAAHMASAQNVEAFGVFGGFNVPFTIDQGLQKDPRYFGKVTFRATPVGFSYGYDHVGFGFLVSPSYLQIGQRFIIKNTAGGEVGTRNVSLNYFSVPAALKLHLNDLAFFRLSLVASINVNVMVNGYETISHTASKLKYPPNVIVPNEPGYVQSYDGVFVPEVSGLKYVTKDKFNTLQLFAGVGFRSDFDLSDEWSLNFDGRANFGIFDPRKTDYVNQLKATSSGPVSDLYGARREAYLSVSVGISRIIVMKNKFKPKKTVRTTGGAYPKPRNTKPK